MGASSGSLAGKRKSNESGSREKKGALASAPMLQSKFVKPVW